MTAIPDLGALFNEEGYLNRQRLTPDAVDVLEQCTSWLLEVDRNVYLPIDLMVVLLERGHDGLRRAIAASARGVVDDPTIVDQLKTLSRRVERNAEGAARLHLDQFSLGFAGLLHDGLAWALEAGREQLTEADLVRVLRWRAELQESASIRWAIRQLALPGGELLFESSGELLRAAFDAQLWKRVDDAMRMSGATGLGFLGTPQMVAALCVERGLLVGACDATGVTPRKLHDDLLAIVGTRVPPQGQFPLNRQTITPRLVRMLIAAAQLAEAHGEPIHEAHLLEAFLTDGGSSLEVVKAEGIVPAIRQAVDVFNKRGGHTSRVSVLDGTQVGGELAPAASATPTLDLLGRDLSADARAGTLPAVLGREAELQRIVNVLMRSEQRNPLLTGQPGVGKTALAVSLAQLIESGRVPDRLKNQRVIEINGASLIGGTSYRGELEARIKGLLDECENDVILFIDEAHAVFAPRSSAGQPGEVPNHFKAALASGKIAVVAATTEMEYRRWIEEDPALKRRFERIDIPELSTELTRDILAHLAPIYEKSYGVPLTPEAVDAAVELSDRFMPEQALPDKAKKLLMDAAIAVAAERAREAHDQGVEGDPDGTPAKRVVSRIDVARQVAEKTGAPLDRIVAGSIRWWVGLQTRLERHVVAQAEAVQTVSQRLIAARLSNLGRKRPQAVFLFAGPPGVGKRDLACGMAAEIYGSDKAVIRLEMSDFSESHSMSRLIGTPPGYAGYQDEDVLVTPLRRTPSVVVLLENFPMAHPRVQERLIRLLADGEIQDTRGMAADASHAIFILTTEFEWQDHGRIGFGDSDTQAPVTLERIDRGLAERLRGHSIELVPFRGMQDAASSLAQQLLQRRMREFRHALQDEYGLTLELPLELEERLMKRVSTLTDARDIETVFRELVIEPVCEKLLGESPNDVLEVPGEREPTRA